MSGRTPLVSGNWKMHLNHLEATMLLQRLSYEVDKDVLDRVDVSVHPPFTDIRSVQTVLDADRMGFLLGAQHCHSEDSGAYTGEVAPPMLAKLDVELVIAGHSERRQVFGESDEVVNAKVRAIMRHGMTPILCVGETLDEREAGEAESVTSGQLRAGLAGVAVSDLAKVVVAYEPVWAIGTGKTALPEDAQAMCAVIRGVLAELDADAAEQIRIQYGGSVKPGNATELLSLPDVDGALVGGASLEAADFAQIIAAAG
ncbi:MAG: triose-phosphate isomerase [Actinomycetota bacterium]